MLTHDVRTRCETDRLVAGQFVCSEQAARLLQCCVVQQRADRTWSCDTRMSAHQSSSSSSSSVVGTGTSRTSVTCCLCWTMPSSVHRHAVPVRPAALPASVRPATHWTMTMMSMLLLLQPSDCETVRVCSLVTHTHPFNGPLSGTTQVSQYQKGKTNADVTEA